MSSCLYNSSVHIWTGQSSGTQRGDIRYYTSSFGMGRMPSSWSLVTSFGMSGCPLAVLSEESFVAASRLAAIRAAYLQGDEVLLIKFSLLKLEGLSEVFPSSTASYRPRERSWMQQTA